MPLDRAKTRANAEKLLRANRVQEAIRELQKLAEDNPHDIQTLNQIGNLYLRLGNKESAVPMFLKVAELYNKSGFATKAVASLKIATREQPDNLPAWEMLASLSEQQGFAREARQAYDQVAQLVGRTGNLDQAIRIQRKIIELEPDNLKVRIQMGDNLVKMGKTDEGVKEYLKAATQFMSQGLVKEATRLYERALQLGPDNLRVLEGLIKNHMTRQQHDQALKLLDGLLEKHATSEALLLLKAEVLTDLKQLAQAELAVRQILSAHPDSGMARARLVRLFLLQQKFDDVASLLDPWVRTCEADRLPELEALYEEVLRFSPEHVPSLLGIANVFRRQKNNVRLTGVLGKMASKNQQEGRLEEARQCLLELAQMEPGNAGYTNRLREVETQMGLRGKPAPPPPPKPAQPPPRPVQPPPEPPKPVAPPKPPPPPPPPKPPTPALEEIAIEVEGTGEVEIEIDMEDLQPPAVEVTASQVRPVPPPLPPEPQPPPPKGRGAEAPSIEIPLAAPPKRVALDAREAEVIREQLTEADVFLKYGLTEKAIAELLTVLKKVPDHVHAHQRLIAIYKKQRKPDKAVKQIIKLAKVFKEQGEADTYENLLEEARALDPNSEDLQEFLGRTPPPMPKVEEPRPPSRRPPEPPPPPPEVREEEKPVQRMAPIRPPAPPPEPAERAPSRQTAQPIPELDLGLLVPAGQAKGIQPQESEVIISLDEELERGGAVSPRDSTAGPSPTPLMPETVVEPMEGGGEFELQGGFELPPIELPKPPAQPPALPQAEAEDTDLADQIEEAEFYLSQELYGEAQRAIASMETRWPSVPAVAVLRKRLVMSMGHAMSQPAASLEVKGLEELPVEARAPFEAEKPPLEIGAETSSPLEVQIPEDEILDVGVESTGAQVVELRPDQEEAPAVRAELPEEAVVEPFVTEEPPRRAPVAEPEISVEVSPFVDEASPDVSTGSGLIPGLPPEPAEVPPPVKAKKPAEPLPVLPPPAEVKKVAKKPVPVQAFQPEQYLESLPAAKKAQAVDSSKLLEGITVGRTERVKTTAPPMPDLSDLLGIIREKPAADREPEKPADLMAEFERGPTKMKVASKDLLPEEILVQEKETFVEEEQKDEYYDLATELGAALEGLQSHEETLFEEEGKSPEEMSFEEVFQEFKKGVEKKVSEEDASTHYNLGIAYKEMELLDEAIGEFQIAARAPQFFIECCSMLGICFRQKGLGELAEKWYRKGIAAPGFSDEAYIGLKYDLAEALDEEGRRDDASALFKEVYAINANYRDVKERVKKLTK